MSFQQGRSRLTALTRDLSARWQETREGWNDAKRDEFEQRFLQPLLAAAQKAEVSLDQLEEVLSRVRRDCE